MKNYKIIVRDAKKVKFIKQLLKEFGLNEIETDVFSDKKTVPKKTTKKRDEDKKPIKRKSSKKVSDKKTPTKKATAPKKRVTKK